MQTRHLEWLQAAGAMTMDLARDAHARAKAQLASTEPAPPTAKDETLRFTRLIATLRQLIAAEARAAAGPAPAASARRPVQGRSPTANDPRHAVLRRTLHQAVRADPDAARLRRVIDQELEHELADDPALTITAGNILFAIADRLDIPLEIAKLPDELLPDEDDEDEEDDEGANLDHPPRPGD